MPEPQNRHHPPPQGVFDFVRQLDAVLEHVIWDNPRVDGTKIEATATQGCQCDTHGVQITATFDGARWDLSIENLESLEDLRHLLTTEVP